MTISKVKLDWIDALKAFALLGILLNHAVESYGIMPWFSNPSEYWPSFDERMANIFPKEGSLFVRIIQFLGWLGDMGPGVFILLSGLTLTLSALNKPVEKIDFYKARAIRIYPLYITIHFITILIAIFLFKWKIDNFWIPFSFAGLRFTNNLFWFINPSWWFIWLVIQLYFFFPFLLDLLRKKSALFFLLITLLITILSRTSGVLGFTLTADLDKWMTGLFAGTRLFEFTFGMYIGLLIKNNDIDFRKLLSDPVKFSLVSFVIYIIGFFSSLTLIGSIFSIIFITIGLTGIFYSIYEYIVKGHLKFEKFIIWIGKNSFSTFLIHQTFMNYYGKELNGNSKLAALILIIFLSIIAGHYIEKLVIMLFNYLIIKYNQLINFSKKRINPISGIVIVFCNSILSFLLAVGQIHNFRIVLLFQLIQFFYLAFYRLLINPIKISNLTRYYDLAIIITFFVLLFRGHWFATFILLIFFSYTFLLLTKKMRHWKAVISVVSILIFSIFIIEFYLRNYKPLETNSWGELPALQSDNETTYALIPNKRTHLRYNNYNYLLVTNSLGFASPEINYNQKSNDETRIMITGDAFSMPEGLEYENSYSAKLQKKLNEKFPGKTIKVVNAGVTGYGPNEVYAQLKKYIDLINPDIVINEMFINEFLEINLNREQRLKEIGLKRNGEEKKRFRDKFMQLGNFQLNIQFPFYLKNLIGANENYNYNKTLLNFYEKNSPFYNDSVITKLNYYLVNMKELCVNHQAELIVMGVPGQVEVTDPLYIRYFPESVNINDTSVFDLNKPLLIFEELCGKNDILYINSRTFLKNHPSQPLYFEKSWHWNSLGHEVVADYLLQYLVKGDLLNK